MPTMLLILACTVFTGLSMLSVWWLVRRSTRPDEDHRHSPGSVVPVSILKPLCGVDDQLETNLESFFNLDYPRFEILFGIEGAGDPAADVVRALCRRHPQVSARLVVHHGSTAINPKVSNLMATAPHAAHDVLVISDSNVKVPADYLWSMVKELEKVEVGLVTSMFTGTSERSLGASLENLHTNGLIAGSVASSQVVGGRPIAVGKSMMFRRSVFQKLGGFEAIANVLAEDYVMGRMFDSAGFRVRVCPRVIQHVCSRTTVRAFLQRHLRWNLMRSRLKPLVYPLEPLVNPVAVAAVACLLGAPVGWTWLWGLSLCILRDVVQWCWLRGSADVWRVVPLSPLKELLILGVWAAAPFFRHVTWRGHRVRLSAGTHLYATGLR